MNKSSFQAVQAMVGMAQVTQMVHAPLMKADAVIPAVNPLADDDGCLGI